MASLPADHLDLVDRALPAVLTTEMPTGRLQSTVVWCNRDGDDVLLNTMREFQKAKNLAARPRATVLIVDPEDIGRWIEVRGSAVLEEDGAIEHLDALSRLYTGDAPYFGRVVAAELAEVEHPVRIRLVPATVTSGRPVVRDASKTVAALPPRWNERRACDDDVPIPDSHRDLLERPLIASLATRSPGGAAQTHPVWFDLDGGDVLVSTTRERQKGRNLEADPRATMLVVDPGDDGRWIEIRADADLRGDELDEVVDRLTRRYTEHERFYGGVYPSDRRERETRTTVRLHPRRINLDAIH